MCITIQKIFQSHLQALLDSKAPLSRDMLRAAFCIRDCQTPSMGTHLVKCPDDHVCTIEYNSCKHRICQECNALERQRWLHRWTQRLLPCPHHHVVFTVPHELLDLWRYNKRNFADILFAAASGALRKLLADPKYCGGRPGLLAALHTWSQTLAAHVHLHVLVTAGGLDEQTDRWRPTKRERLLPRKVLMIIFRGKFRALVLEALAAGELKLPPSSSNSGHLSSPEQLSNFWLNQLNRLGRLPWNVKVFGRYRDGQTVAIYLARYLRGGPIGNSRLISCDGEHLQFRSRVPAHEGQDCSRQTVTTLTVMEFMSRLLEHVPERGSQTVRGYGLYSGNQHIRLTEAFTALGSQRPSPENDKLDIAKWLIQQGRDPKSLCCPVCGKKLEIIHTITRRRRLPSRSPPTGIDITNPQATPA